MPTPLERLQKIVESRTPSEVIFKVDKKSDDTISLNAEIKKPGEYKIIAEDAELQDALAKEITESWDAYLGRFVINCNTDSLWMHIKLTIIREYEQVSGRCAATKRKTEQFIREIKIGDKHLPNYLLQVFIRVKSLAYNKMTKQEQQDLFEQFESLRRTYGK